jgi:cytochrome c-type biogenesis protein CcmH/NrfF
MLLLKLKLIWNPRLKTTTLLLVMLPLMVSVVTHAVVWGR